MQSPPPPALRAPIAPLGRVAKVPLWRIVVKRKVVPRWVPPVVAAQPLPHARAVLLPPSLTVKEADIFPVRLRPLLISTAGSRANARAQKRRAKGVGGGMGGLDLGLWLLWCQVLRLTVMGLRRTRTLSLPHQAWSRLTPYKRRFEI